MLSFDCCDTFVEDSATVGEVSGRCMLVEFCCDLSIEGFVWEAGEEVLCGVITREVGMYRLGDRVLRGGECRPAPGGAVNDHLEGRLPCFFCDHCFDPRLRTRGAAELARN